MISIVSKVLITAQDKPKVSKIKYLGLNDTFNVK